MGDKEPKLAMLYNQQWAWDTNSATKPLAYNLSCLQDVLGQCAELVRVANQCQG